MNHPAFNDIQVACELIQPYIHKTPVHSSELLNQLFGCQVQFKCENFQKAGAFKYRGATHAVLRLTYTEKTNGVATHSSGNHAAALAKAASLRGIPAYIVMPKNAPKVKIEAVQAYGGIITFCEPTLHARETELQKVVEKTGAKFIHPYDNFNVVCGQGTACLELAGQISIPDIIMAPVGGGGLLSGTALAAKNLWPNIKVVGAEPANADDACQSFQNKKLIPVQTTNTIADGLRTSLSAFTYSIIARYVDDIMLCTEESIAEAMKLIFQYLKIVVEPSSAVPLACIMEHREYFNGKKVVVILSGGNIDLAALPFR